MGSPSVVSPASEDLSARELQVLALAAQGMTNVQIAQRLELSIHAVKFHLAGVYRKLRVANRTEAAVLYLRDPLKGTAERRER